MDTTARTAARLAAGEALAAIVPARLAQLVAGVSSTMTFFRLTMAASRSFWPAGGVGSSALAADESNASAAAASPATATEVPLLVSRLERSPCRFFRSNGTSRRGPA